MGQKSEHRTAPISQGEAAIQILVGLLAGPLLILCIYQVVGRVWRSIGDWMMTGWGALLIPIFVATSLAGLVHWRASRFRTAAWTTWAAAVAFHLWFEFVVVASLPGPDF
ncbi:hypothetical protein [Rhodococcus sp. NPDC058514]|uniref:hypothetical protein n=1 Tax=unclassified Rhodococcus (in: high G+C Gram-positive bacteria) TaxID=192944 RepID=UPI0036591591